MNQTDSNSLCFRLSFRANKFARSNEFERENRIPLFPDKLYGLSVSFLADPTVSLALKVLSAGYMLWIAWVCLAAAYRFSAVTESAGKGAAHPSFTVGAILMLSNPKAYAIIAAMFSGFMGSDASATRLMFITVIFTLNNMVAFYAWAFAGKALTRYLDGRAAYLVYGLSFLAVGIWMLLR